jgi:hypothetical protein
LAFSAASIFRLVFFIVRSLYHDRTASAANSPLHDFFRRKHHDP